MFEWFTEFMESPLGKLISTGILAVAGLLLTLGGGRGCRGPDWSIG